MAYTEEQKRMHIRELQFYLYHLSRVRGLPSIAVDGFYGTQTTAVVSEFQRQSHLSVTGAVDTETWSTIVAAYRADIEMTDLTAVLFPIGIRKFTTNAKNAMVYLLQATLLSIQATYPNITQVEVTGTYDTKTQQAVAEFQAYTNLPPSGEIDDDTWNRLAAAAGITTK